MVIYDGVLVCLPLLPVASATVYFYLRLLRSIQYKLVQTEGKHHRQNIDILKLSVVPRNFEEIIYEYNIKLYCFDMALKEILVRLHLYTNK